MAESEIITGFRPPSDVPILVDESEIITGFRPPSDVPIQQKKNTDPTWGAIKIKPKDPFAITKEDIAELKRSAYEETKSNGMTIRKPKADTQKKINTIKALERNLKLSESQIAQEEDKVKGLETPMVAPTDIIFGGAFGARLAQKAGTSIIGGAVREGLSQVTLGGSDIVEAGLKKIVNPKLITGDTAKTVTEGVEQTVNKDLATIKIPDAEYIPPEKGLAEIPSKKIPPNSKQPTKPFGKYAGSVNLEKQNISDAAKQFEFDTFDKEGIKTVLHNDELNAMADARIKVYNEKPEVLQGLIDDVKAGKPIPKEDQLAHRKINAFNVEEYQKTASDYLDGKITIDELHVKEDAVKDFFMKTINPEASEAGRTLQMYNIEVGKAKVAKAQVALEKRLNERQLLEYSQIKWEDPASVREFIKRLPDPKLMDYVKSIYYNNILSGIPTHIKNVASNTIWGAYQIPHRAITAGVDASRYAVGKAIQKVMPTFNVKPRQYFMNEIVPMMMGYKTGFKSGAEGFAEVMKTGRALEMRSKLGRDVGEEVLTAFSRAPETMKFFGKEFNTKWISKYGKIQELPTRGMQGMDLWANCMAYDGQLGALAKRKAMQEGIANKLSKVEINKLYETYMKNPSRQMMDEANKYAKYATFMDEPGKIATKVSELRGAIDDKTGIVGTMIVPFINTVSNIIKRGSELTPGVGLLLAKGRNPIEVVAKQIEGSIIAISLMNKYANGEITFEAPSDPGKRDIFFAEKGPYMIKFGDTWVSYRMEPFNYVISNVGTIYNSIANAKDTDSATDIFMNMASGIVGNVVDSSWAQGVAEVSDRFAKRETLLQKKLIAFVPFSGMLRSLAKATEVIMESENIEGLYKGNVKYRDQKDIVGMLANTIPGLYNLKKPKLNIWGEEVEIQGGAFRQWLPFKWQTPSADACDKYFEKLDFYPSLPKNSFTFMKKDTKMPDDVYRNYCIMYGKEAKNFTEEKINDSYFMNLSKEQQLKILDNRFRDLKESEKSKAINLYKKDKGLKNYREVWAEFTK